MHLGKWKCKNKTKETCGTKNKETALLAYEPYENKDSKYLTATLHKNNYTNSFRQDNRRSNSKQTDDELRPRCEELGGGNQV